MQRTGNENPARQCFFGSEFFVNNDTRLSPNWKPKFATVDSCFDIVVSGQHGVCTQFICLGNSMIFWIFPVVHCHAFCMWHWPIWIWLSAEVITICLWWVWKNSQPADYFITCYTMLSRHKNVETTVHGGNFWLSVWTQPCVIVYKNLASNRALYCCSEHFVETDY